MRFTLASLILLATVGVYVGCKKEVPARTNESEVIKLLGKPDKVILNPTTEALWRPQEPQCAGKQLTKCLVYEHWLTRSQLIYIDSAGRVVCQETGWILRGR